MSFNTLAGSQCLSSKTVADVLVAARRILNEESADFWTQADLIEWTNQAAQSVGAMNLCLGVTENVTLVADTVEYALATNNFIAEVGAVFDGKKGLEPGNPARVGNVPDPGEPTEYYLWDGNIGIYPPPAAGADAVGKTVKVYLAVLPATVSATTDDVPLPAFYDTAIIDYVIAKAFYKDSKPILGDKHMAQFEAAVGRFRADFNEAGGA